MPDNASSLMSLVEQLREKQRQSWQMGECLPVEALVESVPELADHPEAHLDLIYAEFRLLEKAGERPTLEEYQRRFPTLAEPLRMQLEVHHALAGSAKPESTRELEQKAIAKAPATEVQTNPMIDNYAVLGELGGGGMGIVYKAKHTILNRIVALKTMRSDLAAQPNWAHRFDREIRISAELEHPHIVPITNVGKHIGKPYYTMPLMTGGSLAEQLERLQSRPREALVLMEKVARAVQYAHDKRILHRDLKPGNVLLDGDGEPRVSDFGLAKVCAEEVELTQTGMAIGTPPYMAPEQVTARKAQIGPATDVWALGVMLYELLVGRRPFTGNEAEELKRKIVHTAPPLPRTIRPELHPDLEQILVRCLEKNPQQRYTTAAALADALKTHLDGERLAPEPWRRRVRQQIRRHPFRSGILCLGAAAVIFLATVLVWREMNRPDDPIILLDASGPPHPPQHTRWIIGSDKVKIIPAATHEPFTLQTEPHEMVMLQMAPSPPWKHYRLQAEVRHEAGTDGEVGIFVHYGRHLGLQGVFHTAWFAGFGTHERKAGVVLLSLACLDQRGKWWGGHDLDRPDHFLFDHPLIHNPLEWRRLAVDVDAKGLQAFLDEKSFGSVTPNEIEEKTVESTHRVKDVQFDLATEKNVLGIYLYDSRASFRNVAVKPLP